MFKLETFGAWFNGKSIAVVGNSKGLLNLNQGTEIDSHDVVCRMNKAFQILPPVTNQYKNSIGSKIDFLFVNLYRTSGFRQAQSNIKVIQTTPCSHDDPNIIKHVAWIPYREYLQSIFDEFTGFMPSTGLRVLHLLKTYTKPKIIDVYGFDWKQKFPTFSGGSDNWNQRVHNFKKEKEYCINNFFTSGNIFVHHE